MIEWIAQNKAWLFDGLLVAVPIAIFGWIFASRSDRTRQTQKGGKSSFNIQVGGHVKAGRDVNMGGKDREP
jgi:hypothetical protein